MATTTLDSFRRSTELPAIAAQPPIKPKLKKVETSATIVICLICGWKGDSHELLKGSGDGLDCPGGHPRARYLVCKEDFDDPAEFAVTRPPATIDAARAKRKELKLRATSEVIAFEKKVKEIQGRERR